MRIQHNIPAMSAYRNYSTNVSALSKNLEKLSSGYKINRAGDDAAGLAISEKMRAQITGLETAQKNAKDGISLVQTAEGALTEVHDMLNRMYELAEQSANGTYADDVDRVQLQKEIDSLRTEINRIADSSNFNGIKLLDGSMSAKGTVAFAGVTTPFGDIPGVGDTLGTDTVLHKGATTPPTATTFSVDLHNVKFANTKAGETMTIKIGNTEFKYTAQDADADDTANGVFQAGANKAMTAANIATAFEKGKFTNSDGSAMNVGKATIDGKEYAVTATGNRITFTSTEDGLNPDMKVEIKGEGAEATKEVGQGAVTTVATNPAVNKTDGAGGGTPSKEVAKFDLSGFTVGTAGMVKFTVAGQDVELEVTASTTAAQVAQALAAQLDGKVADGINGDSKYVVTSNNNELIFTGSDTGNATDITGNITAAAGTAKPATEATDNPVSGDYNVSTTVLERKGIAGNNRLASTHFKLTKDMVVDGAKIKIGDDEYTFTKDSSSTIAKKVDISDLDENADDYLTKVAEKLTKAAENNATWTVGHDGARMTVTEKYDGTNAWNDTVANKNKYDLSTLEGIKKSLGYTSGANEAKAGKALTLQIGDTAEEFNQLTVDVKDCHAAAMGIGSIDISTQEGASDAMGDIKDAINYVSDVRGSLGALQNRLDHTISNLSVMQENIQDAESTIRDVDVAKEMMEYTKNSILVQSAQAMLAQANQLPQGVLQLLG